MQNEDLRALCERMEDWVKTFPHSAPLAITMRSAIDAIEAQQRRVGELEARLEVYATDEAGNKVLAGADGIACRNETISLLEGTLDSRNRNLEYIQRRVIIYEAALFTISASVESERLGEYVRGIARAALTPSTPERGTEL